MADKNWGIKVHCECGAKYYTMNKKDKITCPVCSAEYVPEDLNLRSAPISTPKTHDKNKIEDIENIEESSEDNDDIISLEDQKEIEESNEDFKPD